MKDPVKTTDEAVDDLSVASKAESPVALTIKLGSWLDRFVRLPDGATRDPEDSGLYHYRPESLLTPLEVLANFSIPINEVGFIAFNQKAIPIDCKIREAGLLNFYPMIIGG